MYHRNFGNVPEEKQKREALSFRIQMKTKCIFFLLIYFVCSAITNAAIDLSPVLLGILFTLVLLCFVIFVKVYCYRSTAANANDLHNDRKHMNNVNYKDAVKVMKVFTIMFLLVRLSEKTH